MYKKFILIFSSLTLVTTINIYACDNDNMGEMASANYLCDTKSVDNSETIDKSKHVSEVFEKPSDDAFDASRNMRTSEYEANAIEISQSRTKRIEDMNHGENYIDTAHKSLGYLQIDTVLPVPSHHYDYEEVRQKEFNEKSHNHFNSKRVKTTELVDETFSKKTNKSIHTQNSIEENVTSKNDNIKTDAVDSNTYNEETKSIDKLKHDNIITTNNLSDDNSAAPISKQLNIKSTSPSEQGLKSSQPAPIINSHAPANNKIAHLEYNDNELEISYENQEILNQVIEKFNISENKIIKIQSFAYLEDANNKLEDARRNAFQRAVKVRKYLIEKDIDIANISVNAVEDAESKLNRIEISFEDIK